MFYHVLQESYQKDVPTNNVDVPVKQKDDPNKQKDVPQPKQFTNQQPFKLKRTYQKNNKYDGPDFKVSVKINQTRTNLHGKANGSTTLHQTYLHHTMQWSKPLRRTLQCRSLQRLWNRKVVY